MRVDAALGLYNASTIFCCDARSRRPYAIGPVCLDQRRASRPEDPRRCATLGDKGETTEMHHSLCSPWSKQPIIMETNVDSPAQLPSSAGPSPRPDKQVKTRSRNGCLVCRARRIRCDEGACTGSTADALKLRFPVLDHVGSKLIAGKPECQRCIKYSAEVSSP